MVYTRLLDTGLKYDEIPKRTLPQIKALLGEWAELLSLKIPGPFGGIAQTPQEQQEVDSPPKINQFAALASMFNGF